MPYSVVIAGSTQRTELFAQTLDADKRFVVDLVITPIPKPRGRTQEIIDNPLLAWTKDNQINFILIDKCIKKSLFAQYLSKPTDFLLVVDFGYLVPDWLLKWPKVAALNIHPSALPRWRGNAPAPHVIINGDSQSAVTLIEMNQKLDQGPIVSQYFFPVQPHWTQTEYYQHAFEIMAKKLGDDLNRLANKQITPQPQPPDSPTPIAARLNKQSSFISWDDLSQALNGQPNNSVSFTNPLAIEQACRAFQPWPSLWTLIPTVKGEKRLKILASHLDAQNRLILDRVQLEGKQPSTWNQIKNVLKPVAN